MKRLLAAVDQLLGSRSPGLLLATALLLVGLLAAINSTISAEVSFSVFYLLPISAVAWYGGESRAVAISLLSATAWMLASYLPGRHDLTSWIPYWNGAVRLGFFLTVAFLLSALRAALGRERDLARVDGLTGLLNARSLMKVAAIEVARAQRYRRPVTVAYIDADNFKTVNDRSGHAEGDRVLQAVGDALRTQLRKSDSVARLAGDEFALLLPETGRPEAEAVMAKVAAALRCAMQQGGWPVTFSIGAVVSATPPVSMEDLLHRADSAMYTVKRDRKDGLSLVVLE